MGYCLTHNQSYAENMGGYCPYCGPPQAKIWTTTGTTTNECEKCKDCGLVKTCKPPKHEYIKDCTTCVWGAECNDGDCRGDNYHRWELSRWLGGEK